MLVDRLNRLVSEMKKENFLKRDVGVYLFEHQSNPHKMAVMEIENEKNRLMLCYTIQRDGDIHVNIEDTPIRDGVRLESESSESELYIEDDELTDVTVEILSEYGVTNVK